MSMDALLYSPRDRAKSNAEASEEADSRLDEQDPNRINPPDDSPMLVVPYYHDSKEPNLFEKLFGFRF